MFNLFENELLNFYRKNVTNWALLFKSKPTKFFCVLSVQLCILASWVFFCLSELDNSDKQVLLYFIIFFVLQIIWCLFFGFFVIKSARTDFFRRYNIDLYNEEGEPFKYLLVKKFLIHKKILSGLLERESIEKDEASLDFYIERLEKRFERKKKNRFLTIFSSYSAILVALVVPVWAAFNNWVYMHDKNSFISFGQATAYLAIIVLTIFFFLGGFIFVKDLFIKDLLQLEDQRISNLIEMLQSIRFSLNHSHYLGEFEKREHIKDSIEKIINEYEINELEEKEQNRYAWWKFNVSKEVIMSKKEE